MTEVERPRDEKVDHLSKFLQEVKELTADNQDEVCEIDENAIVKDHFIVKVLKAFVMKTEFSSPASSKIFYSVKDPTWVSGFGSME